MDIQSLPLAAVNSPGRCRNATSKTEPSASELAFERAERQRALLEKAFAPNDAFNKMVEQARRASDLLQPYSAAQGIVEQAERMAIMAQPSMALSEMAEGVVRATDLVNASSAMQEAVRQAERTAKMMQPSDGVTKMLEEVARSQKAMLSSSELLTEAFEPTRALLDQFKNRHTFSLGISDALRLEPLFTGVTSFPTATELAANFFRSVKLPESFGLDMKHMRFPSLHDALGLSGLGATLRADIAGVSAVFSKLMDEVKELANSMGVSTELVFDAMENVSWDERVGKEQRRQLLESVKVEIARLKSEVSGAGADACDGTERSFIEFLGPQNKLLIAELAKHPENMHRLKPREFEILVADILSDLGWNVELTPASKDGGKDIIATGLVCGLPVLALVECKNYSPLNKVEVKIVREFMYTVLESRATVGMIATSSTFTKGAKEEASKHQWRLHLHDFDYLSSLLTKFGTHRRDQSSGLWLSKSCSIATGQVLQGG